MRIGRKILAGILTTAASGGLATAGQAQTNIAIINPNFSEVYQSQTNYQASLSNPSAAITGNLNNGYSLGWGTTTFSNSLTFSDGSTSTAGYVPGWTGAGGEQYLGATTAAPNPRSGGTYAWSNSGNFSQTLADNITAGATYLLTAGIDNRYSGDGPVMQLTAGGTALTGGTLFGAPAGYRQAPNTVAELVTAPAGATGALGITLGNSSGGQTDFNNVQLVENPTGIPTIYANGLTVNNLGGVAPSPGPTDQANLSPTGTVNNAYPGNPTGNTVNYYTNNGAPPGQSFTTGTAQAYTLNSITVLDFDEHGGFGDNAAITVSISSVSNGKYTLVGVVTGAVPVGTSTATGDYVQLALNTPITLNGSSLYGYSISSNTGYSGLATDTNSDYTGGTLADFLSGSSPFGGTLQTSTVVPSSVFDVSLTAVPEPASLTILAVAGGLLLLARRRLVKS